MAYPVSTEFKKALLSSHKMVSRVELYVNKQLQNVDLKITGGYVTISRSDEARRTAYFTAISNNDNMTPDGTTTSTLNIYNCEMKPYRGLVLPSGLTEEVPLGVFPVSSIEVAEGGQGLYIKVSGSDRSREVVRGSLEITYIITKGTNVVLAIKSILTTCYPGILFGTVSTTTFATAQLAYPPGTNMWEVVKKLADSIGFDVYFDANGLCVIKKAVDPFSLTTNWEYAEGANCTMLSQQKYYDDDEQFNYIVVTGDNPATAGIIRAVAMDNNPTSPTYYKGPYGKVVKMVSSAAVATNEQAQLLADKELQNSLGQDEMLYLVTVPNPALDIDDLVYCKRAKAKTDGYYILDQQTIPLEAQAAANIGIRKRVAQV